MSQSCTLSSSSASMMMAFLMNHDPMFAILCSNLFCIYLEFNSLLMSSTLYTLIAFTATGALLPSIVGLGVGLMVPAAMSSFGTVVAGVGTIHTP